MPQFPQFVPYIPWAPASNDALLRNFSDILLKKLVDCSTLSDLREIYIDLTRFVPETRERFLSLFDDNIQGDTIGELREVSVCSISLTLYNKFLCPDVQAEIFSFLDTWDIGSCLLAVAWDNC